MLLFLEVPVVAAWYFVLVVFLPVVIASQSGCIGGAPSLSSADPGRRRMEVLREAGGAF